jgi:Trypsin
VRFREVIVHSSCLFSDCQCAKILTSSPIHTRTSPFPTSGDSGGPLLLRNESLAFYDTTTNKNTPTFEVPYLQVGVTSWGFGCGSDEFPGVYARVSAQFEWIRAEVCNLSAVPPSYFDCNRETLSPAQDVTITLIVNFDDFPSEVGWILVDETAFGELVAEVMPEENERFSERSTGAFSYTVKERSEYSFYIFDIAMDGLCCDEEGSYELVIGTQNSTILVLASGGGNFGSEELFTFEIPSLADLGTMSPTASPTPLTGASPAPSSVANGTALGTAAPTMAATPMINSSSFTPTSIPPVEIGPPAVVSTTEAPSTLPTTTVSSSPSALATLSNSTAPTTVEEPLSNKTATLEPSAVDGGTDDRDCGEQGNQGDCENPSAASSGSRASGVLIATLLITATSSILPISNRP